MGYIIGAMIALAAMLYETPSLLHWLTSASKTQTETVAAGQAQTIAQAATQYINANQATLESQATSTTAVTVSVANLQSGGYLPTSVSTLNPYGQTWQVEILQPSAGVLQAVLSTTGGQTLDDQMASQIAQAIGSTGGYLPSAAGATRLGLAANTIVGAGGGWTLAVGSLPIAKGSIAVAVTQGATSASNSYLYRDSVPGNPQYNTMTTPLIMSATVTVGNGCTTAGAIAQDGTGALVTCKGAVWMSYADGHWKAPAANYASLPASGNSTGDTRVATDTFRAYSWNGSSWAALAIDQNGNLTVPATLTVSGNANVAGTMTAATVEGTNTVAAYSGATAVAGVNTSGRVWGTNFAADNTTGWGVNPGYTSGWSMVTSVGVTGTLNASAANSSGSIDANDYYDRAGGQWLSTVISNLTSLSNTVNSLSSTVGSLSSTVNTLNSSVTNQGSTISSLSGEYNTLSNTVSSLSGGSCTFSGNGACILPDGMYLEWGSFSWNGSSGKVSVSYPKPFPHAAFSVTTTQPAPGGNGYPIESALSTNSAFIWNSSSTGDVASTIYFMAVGY